MQDGSPGFPETVDDHGTNDKLNDAEMSDGTERKAAADAAVGGVVSAVSRRQRLSWLSLTSWVTT